ncbi:hypothetical protein DFQ27_004534 [Actinomortierella ambigua]|uniref:Sphingolipid long chain base-responsive protein LSP1 n=1 Tax=Actinomortierella ambigua TaxID=1343610 RepID=A0A9P6U4D0_9FUNG|nr:hypothetical protein DFQ27_004534 [Actinomortierella ambigua]
MSHLVDPCLTMTKLVHGIRRGIDTVSPLSGLTASLRILIQEQKNVLTSTKRATFEKDEAAKHLAIWGSGEGADIADITAKLAMLIQRATNLERGYADRLAESRELFKEIRVAEDGNYDTRKKRLDLQEKLVVAPKEDVQQEMKLLRKETMSVENDLEDMKRKNLKKAALNQLAALEELGKGLIVIAHYGKEVMSYLDATPTQAGVHADERFAAYDGAAKTACAVKACMDSLKNWKMYAPNVEIQPIDLGDFPKDNKEAADALLKELAVKTDSDWFDLQAPPSLSSPTSIISMDKLKQAHNRNSSSSSLVSPPATASAALPDSPRNSISSSITTVTYVDGVPAVSMIQEIPPTPDLDDSPAVPKTSILSISVAANTPTLEKDADTGKSMSDTSEPRQEDIPAEPTESEEKERPHDKEQVKESDQPPPPPPEKDQSTSPPPPPKPSPFVPQSTYKPHTTYTPTHHSAVSNPPSATSSPALSATHVATSPPLAARLSPGLGAHHHPPAHVPYPQLQQQPFYHRQQQQHHHQYQQHHPGDTGRISPTPALPKPRPMSGGSYAPHPLMTPFGAGNNQSAQQTVIPPMYPPMNPTQLHQPLPTQMPIPLQVNMPVPMPMPMPIPVIQPSHSPNPQGAGDTSSSTSSSPKRHSQPISVSFPGIHPSTTTSSTSSSPPPPPPPPKSTSPTPGTGGNKAPIRRNPHAVLPPAEPGFRFPAGYDNDDDAAAAVGFQSSTADPNVEYDGPPPDYAEAAMQPPAELVEEKERKKQASSRS